MGFLKFFKENVFLICVDILVKRMESMIRWEDSNYLMVFFYYDFYIVFVLYRDRYKVL